MCSNHSRIESRRGGLTGAADVHEFRVLAIGLTCEDVETMSGLGSR